MSHCLPIILTKRSLFPKNVMKLTYPEDFIKTNASDTNIKNNLTKFK